MGIASNLVHAYAAKAREDAREYVTVWDGHGSFKVDKEEFKKYGQRGLEKLAELMKQQAQR